MGSNKTDPLATVETDCATGMSRRIFLDTAAGGCAIALLAALGLESTDALALPIVTTTGQQSGNELRYPIPAADSVNVDHAAQVIVVRAHGTSLRVQPVVPASERCGQVAPSRQSFSVHETQLEVHA